MSGSAQFAIEFGLGLTAFCASVVVSMMLPLLKLRRPLLIHWLVWLGGFLVAATPPVIFGTVSPAAGLAAALFSATAIWGSLEGQRRFRHWLYVERPEARRSLERFRAYQASSLMPDADAGPEPPGSRSSPTAKPG